MKHDPGHEHHLHKQSALKTAARGNGMVLLVASAVAVIGAVMYFGLS